jgi:Xaa-Pro aminopeptidase
VAGLLNIAWWDATLADGDVEAIVATTPENVAHLTGFRSPSRDLAPRTQVYAVARRDRDRPPALVCPVGDLDVVLQSGLTGVSCRPYGAFHLELGDAAPEQLARRYRELTHATAASALDALTAVLAEDGASGLVAVDEHGIDPALHARLGERLGERLLGGAALLSRLRSVKSEEEIRLLARAVEATEAGYEAAVAMAAAGVSEAEMARALEEGTRARGGVPVFTVVGFGDGGSLPNGIPRDDRLLEPGEAIRFDIGCRVDGYHSDIARTAVLGEPPEPLRRAYAAILEGEQRALDELRAGASAGAIFDAAVTGTREGGLPRYRRNHVGHGIGLVVYDDPVLTEGSDAQLAAGMVLEVETPYYELGVMGVQVEDTVVVTDGGHELLTRTSRELRVIDA